jgi:small glutamine-rich tetratricopeptide repeat-containing protein alpha
MNKDQRILASSVIKFLQDSCPKEQKDEIMKAVDIIEKVYDCKTLEKEGQVPLEKLYGVYKQTVNPTAKQTGTSAANLKVAEGLKAEGNKLLAAKDFKGAVEKYTAAIEADANNAVYYANRAAAYSQLQQHESAVYDAKKALQVNPNYSKAYSRLGHAEFCLGNYENAVDAYTLGLEKEPNNASIKQSLAAAQQKVGLALIFRCYI